MKNETKEEKQREILELYTIAVTRIDGKFQSCIYIKNDGAIWSGSLRENKRDSILEATCKITGLYAKPSKRRNS